MDKENEEFSKENGGFPIRKKDLRIMADRVITRGDELEKSNPGRNDKEYVARRTEIIEIGTASIGSQIPRIDYNPEEIETWKLLFRQLTKLYPTHACQEYNYIFPLLVENCGYRDDNIPQLEDVSNFLKDCTGFSLNVVPGMLSPRDFLAGLAFRVFHATQYIRHSSDPYYFLEPDLFHELLGHFPMFADRNFAEFAQELGLASLGASNEEIDRLATLYFFTLEFGLCRQPGGEVRVCGGTLLSSPAELQHCLRDEIDNKRPFDPTTVAVQPYKETAKFQPIYFVMENGFQAAAKCLREYTATFSRKFNVRYNAITEKINIINKREHLQSMIMDLKSELQLLSNALEKVNTK